MRKYFVFFILIIFLVTFKAITQNATLVNPSYSPIEFAKLGDSLKLNLYDSLMWDIKGKDLKLASSYADSVIYYGHKLNNKKFLVKPYVLKGQQYTYQAKYIDALEIFDSLYHYAKINGDTTSLLRAKEMQATIYFFFVSQPERAMRLWNRNLSLAKEANNLKYIIQTYKRLGEAYIKKRNFSKAINYLDAASNTIQKNKQYIGIEGDVHLAYSDTYVELKEYKEALNKIELAKRFFFNKPDSQRKFYDLYRAFSESGDVFTKLKQYAKSKEQYDRCIIYLQKSGKSTPRRQALFYLDIGKNQLEQRQFDLALNNFNQALNLIKNSQDNITKFKTYSRLGQVYVQKKQIAKSLSHFQIGLSILTDTLISPTNIYENPDYKNITKHHYYICFILRNKGLAFEKGYQVHQDKKWLENALNCYQKLIGILDAHRASIRSNSSKFFFMEEAFPSYESAVRISNKLYELTGIEDYQNKAIIYSEKAKANLLYALIQEAEENINYKIPDSLLVKKATLELQIAKLENKQKIKNAEKILALKEKLNGIKNEILNNFPNYDKHERSNWAVDIEGIDSKVINPNTCAIEYFYGDSTIYIFAINTSAKKVVTIPRDSVFVQYLESFIDLVQTYDREQQQVKKFIKVANYLYNKLLAPVSDLADGKELILIPDGLLHFLPFEALVTINSDADSSYKRLPYLIHDNPISYAYSLTILETMKGKKNSSINKIAGFAPSFNFKKDDTQDIEIEVVAGLNYRNARKELDFLPMAQKEVKFLQKTFGADIYLGNEATESNFKEVANQYDLLHFATHTLLDDNYPQKSGLLFSNNDTKEDGNLEMYELYGFPLNAEMVVLSACQTGYGKIERGEGIISLARAFTIAGCPSLFMTLWSIEDRSISSLMQKFYLNLKAGEQKNIALQRAKIDYIKNVEDGALAQPLFWAGMIGIGNMDVIHFSSNNKLLYIGLGVGGLLFLLLLWWRRKKKVNQVV